MIDPLFISQNQLTQLIKTDRSMEKLTVNQKTPKQACRAKKKQPLKVVYISNPVKLTATAAQFRALVQELTGRDSNIAETMADQYDIDSSTSTDAVDRQDVASRNDLAAAAGEQKIGGKGMADYHQAAHHHELVDDQEAFSSPLLDNFSALCESQHVGNGFWEY